MRSYTGLVRLLALRPLAARPLRSLLSCVGVGAGVALVLAIQLINGAIADSVRGSADAVAGRATAEVVAPTEAGIDASVPGLVAATPGVDAAVGIVRADGTLNVGGRREVITLLGVPAGYDALVPAGAQTRLEGTFGAPGTASLVLPDGLASRLGVRRGDRVAIAARAARRDVVVSGLLHGGALTRSTAGNLALVALPEAQALLGAPGRLDSVLIVPREGTSYAELEVALTGRLPAGLTVRPPAARATQAERVLRGIRQLLTLASTVALFVGMFVVYNTMSMATTERRRELALLRALGLRRREEERLLRLEAAILGVGGGAVGVAGGYLLAKLLAARVAEGYALLLVLPPVRIRPSTSLLAGAFVLGVAASVVAAVLPARRLRSIAPVEGMRAGSPTEDVHESSRWGARQAARVAVPAVLVAGGCMAVFLTVGRADVVWAVGGLTALMSALAALIPVVVPRVVHVVARLVLQRSPLVGRLAEQSLQRTPRRTSYTVGALLITLMLVIGLGGALGSFRRSLDRLLGALARADVYVVGTDNLAATLPSDVYEELTAQPALTSVWRYRFTPVLWDDQQVALQAWDMASFRRHGGLILEDGDLEEAWDAAIAGTGVIVSTTLARDRELEVGDRVDIPTPAGPQRFDVVAVSNDFLPQGTFYLDWHVAIRHYGDTGVGAFAAVARDGEVVAAREQVRAVVERRQLDVEIQSQAQRRESVLAGIDRTFALADGVQLAGLLVALVAIVNTLLMTVVEREREIGMLRALGLLRRQVSRLVLVEALVIGVVGGALASFAGYLLSVFVTGAMEVGNGWSQVAHVPWRAMLAAPLAAAGVAAVGGWWPARRAARVPIVEAIRSE